MSEIVDIVDEKNEIVGAAPVEEVYEKRLNHRIVHVIVFNDKGEIFLNQRSPKQTFCPGHWSLSAHGNVRRGETYEEAAERELQGTLGVRLALTKVHQGYYDHYKMRKFIEIFRAISSGPFRQNPDIALTGRWFTIADVKDMVKKNQLVHPELAHVMDVLYS